MQFFFFNKLDFIEKIGTSVLELPKNSIKVKKSTGKIVTTLQNPGDVIVAIVDFMDEEGLCLVKQAVNNGKPAKFLLRKEVMMYNCLIGTSVRILRRSKRSTLDCLVLLDTGRSWN